MKAARRIIAKKYPVSILLHDLRSAHNVGAIFRTADAAGVEKIFLSGTTPLPLDRFGRPVGDIAKTALGAEKTVGWESVSLPLALLGKLKKTGIKIIAIEQDARAMDYKKVRMKGAALFIVGNEVNGLPKKILKNCDSIAEIPMRGQKESLNVSVALGVALFRILNI